MLRVFVLRSEAQVAALSEYVARHWKDSTLFVKVTDDESRNLEQNAAQWPILEAFSKQLEWPVNGQMVRMTPEEWKDVLTAAFNNETARLAMGLNGGVVMLGARTSKFGKRKFSEWLDYLGAVAIERGVILD